MQRYDVDESGARFQCSWGDYVLADEAEARVAELERELDETYRQMRHFRALYEGTQERGYLRRTREGKR